MVTSTVGLGRRRARVLINRVTYTVSEPYLTDWKFGKNFLFCAVYQ